jgi:hypothetical protein
VIAEPPVVDGAVHVTVACALPAVAPTVRGTDGGCAGVTGAVAVDAGPVPSPLIALTTNV